MRGCEAPAEISLMSEKQVVEPCTLQLPGEDLLRQIFEKLHALFSLQTRTRAFVYYFNTRNGAEAIVPA